MTLKEALAALKEMGTAQNRKVYARHGVSGNQYGVSCANLKALKKKIKTDHALAQQLWATGNHDARVLATMIADPAQADADALEAWAADLDNYVVTDAFSSFVGRTPWARQKMEAWMESDEEWTGQAGWNLVASAALGSDAYPDAYFEPLLRVIEGRIARAENRVRYAMNNALIAIGARSDALEPLAVAAAERIGPVEVDHGETSCKTPAAGPYIRKARAHRRKKEQKA